MSEHNGHILVVDDTPKNIQVLGSMLREAGYAINAAVNGVQALQTLERITPDLILLDVIMPEMDGIEACKRITADPRLADIPVVFLTAKIEPEDVVKGFEVGAVDYVTKPFNSAELLKRVDTHLSLNRMRKELAGKVNELSGALNQIEQLHREQDSFLRHELNNVIGPIAGYTQMLESQRAGELNEKQLGWVQSIEKGTASMKTMLEQIKKLQDFERGSHELRLMDTPLAGILDDVVRDLSTQFESVIVEYDGAPCAKLRIMADLSFLPGVFKNLIKNAVEHVQHLDPAERTVQVLCGQTGNWVAVRIQNGGEPIPPDRVSTFFEKFNSTKSDEGGTGLGTSYAHLVTRAHSGSITVASDATKGTTVDVFLPSAAS